jgi:hypothetical protein
MGDRITSSRDAVASQIESARDADPPRDVTPSRSERQLRRLARRQGVHLVVDEVAKRAGIGGYALVDWEGGEILYGGGLSWPSCDLDEVEDWLLTPAAVRATWSEA